MILTRLYRKIRNGWDAFLRGPGWLHPAGIWELPSGKRYSSSTVALCRWIAGSFNRIVLPAARPVLPLCLFAGITASVFLHEPVLEAVFFMMAAGAVDLLGGLIFFPRIQAERRLPRRVMCGRTFTAEYTLTNKRKLPAFSIVPDAWLPNRNIVRQEDVVCDLPGEKGACVHLRIPYKVRRRGIYTIPHPVWETGFPFQIFKCSGSYGTAECLTVHPAYHLLKLPRESVRADRTGDREFRACREYRQGDARNSIHWRMTARHGKLIVREFESQDAPAFPDASVILDTTAYPVPVLPRLKQILTGDLLAKPEDQFEKAVSTCASLIHTLFANGAGQVELILTGQGRCYGDEAVLLDCLAGLKKDPRRKKENCGFDHIQPRTDAVFPVLQQKTSAADALIGRLNKRVRYVLIAGQEEVVR